MMSFFKFLDAYTLRARLFPAVLAAAPALAALALLISWEKIALSNMIASGALLVLLFALADFARKEGLRIEPRIYKEMGGKPSITLFRRSDTTIDEHAKDQYRTFLAGKLNRQAPTPADETTDLTAGDSFYEQSGIWLRDNTRDAKKFPLLWNELVSYGFRRNQRGLKWPALVVNVIVVVICAAVLWRRASLDMTDDLVMRTIVVLIIAVVHAAYFALVVTKEGVKEAARRYGRELILCCQSLIMGSPRSAPRKKPVAKAT
ncbi:hypothetical protein ACVWWI_006353 [Bradyrhizobium sp. USDA 3686]|uniref:hypothetical protein n=1 Tax=Bradyrhizobium canariense TaxID=255045 RepID=UPI001FEE67AB|nr:hypothetical protein [Bradyrhizobium canariense]MBM7488096.1 hypothetical protein [Bradyrhizobium canariense]